MKLKYLFLTISMAGVSALMANHNTDTLAVISLNDFHGSFVKSNGVPGAGNVYSSIERIKKRYPAHLVLSAGDNFGGSYFSLLTKGNLLPFFFHSVGIRYSAIGNHEFDNGQDFFEQLGKDTIEYVCGNLTKSGKLLPRTLRKVSSRVALPNSSDTVDVEIIGLISALAKSQCKKEYIDGIDFSDDYMPFITDGLDKSGNKVRILLAHIGTYTDSQGNACWDDVENKASLRFGPDTISGIASGHSHKYVCGYINGVPAVQGTISGKYISVLRFVCKDGKVAPCPPMVVKVEDITDTSETRKEIDRRIARVCSTTTVPSIDMSLSDEIGNAVDTIIHDRNLNPKETTALGTYVCMAYADAYRKARGISDEDPVLAFCHFGCIRRSLYPGRTDVLTAGELLPFSNELKVYNLTGKEIFKIVEAGIKNGKGCMQMNNLVVDITGIGKKTRVVNVWYNIPGREYIALSKNKSYPVVVDKFITTGGDGYPTELFPESKCVKDIKLPGTTDAFLLFLKKMHDRNIPLSSKTLFKANIKRYRND